MKGRKRQRQRGERRVRNIPPPPTDDAMRCAAVFVLMRERLEDFERCAFRGQKLKIDLHGVRVDGILSDVTVEQVIARMVMQGSTARGIAAGLDIPRGIVERAISDLAHGCVVDWAARRMVQ